MASGEVLEKLRNYYSKAENDVMKWDVAHERLISLLGTITNIMERIQALQASKNFGQLASFPSYPEKLLAKQLVALENLLGDAQLALQDMAMAVTGLDKTLKNAERTMQQNKRLSSAARDVAAGPVPSVNQCLEGLKHIWQMHSEELLLQQALTAEVRYGRTKEELGQLLEAAAANCNIEKGRVKDLFSVMAAIAEVRRVMATSTPSNGAKPKVEVEVWSDLACPWCYVGCKRVSKAAEKAHTNGCAEVNITWHAYLLDPTFHMNHEDGEPLDEYLVNKFGPNALSMKGRVVDSGKPDGATFSGWKWRANTFSGHRLVALARQEGKDQEAVTKLFELAYENGENISSLELLEKAGKELGLPGVDEWINSDEGSLDVLRDDSEAKQLGVRGVPAFFIRSGKSQTYMLSGAQPVETFLEVFDKVVEEGN